MRTRLVLLIALAAAACSGGCYYEGGPGYSADTFTYISRPWQPVTVTLKDTRTGQDFWSIDVPVGKRLVVQFSDNFGTGDEYTPAEMSWGLTPESYELGSVDMPNTLPVPPWNSRLLVTTYRPAPELPESMVTATRGAAQPVRVETVRPSSVTMPPEHKPVPSSPKHDAPLDLPDTRPGS